jgi:glycosyltransferase involved in cell wall biosynthesis
MRKVSASYPVVYVVLGMHRSGTSALTAGLELLGIPIGNSMHPPGPDNPKGFWEDREILAINEELLRELNSAYDGFLSSQKLILESSSIQALKIKAISLVKKRLLENSRRWGIKDPRMARLLPFWDLVFKASKCDVKFICALRNPLAVVESLRVRNNIPYSKSLLLWAQHMLPIAKVLLTSNGVLIDYDDYIDRPYEQLKRIADSFKLKLPQKNSKKIIEFESFFLDPSLRHHQYSIDDLEMDPSVPDFVLQLYKLFLKFKDDFKENSEFHVTEFQKISNEISAAESCIPIIELLEDQRLQLWNEIALKDGRIVAITSDIQGLHQSVTERDTRIELLTSDIQGLHQTVTERDAQVQSLGQTVTERDTRIEQLTSDIQGLHQTVTERDHEIFWLKKGLEDSRNEIIAILNTNSWKITKPMRFVRRKLYDEPKVFIKNSLFTITRKVWRALPIDGSKKNYIKYSFNKLVGKVFLQKSITPAQSLKSENFLVSNLENTGGHVPEFVSLTNDPPLLVKPVKLICFYLPQFHEIEENNLWWGTGFTEWTNVVPSRPNFAGHYQPHIPGDLGYYNLLDAGVQEKQVNLAKIYGVEGFCFYFYWFGGKRLLEAPVLNFLENKALDLPFCLCWANENWSRRWDGLDGEILIQQSHSPSDDIEFIKYLSKYLEDDRYIRINGKPLILVYRPRLLPSAKDTSTRWRKWCRENGIGEIYLAYTQSFENDDPKIFGFDAAIEFPPNNSSPPNITTEIMPISEQGFSGTVYDWNIFPERSERYIEPDYTLFRSVCPGWDNTARRGRNGTIFINNSPTGFKRWLKNAIVHTVKAKKNKDERLVFVNAWNEWAEGAHLEPDQKSGYAYLQATREAMEENTSIAGDQSDKKVVLVAHDGHPHGAQFLILNIAKSLAHDFGIKVDLVCLGDGPLIAEYQKYCRVHVLSGVDARGTRAKNLAEKLYEMGHRQAIVNTTVSGKFLETLTRSGIKCISLIHELPGVIEQNKLQDCVASITQYANKIVFPANEVAASFGRYSELSNEKIVIRPQGLYKKRNVDRTRELDRIELRALLNVDPASKIVLGSGYADYRKGIDLFVEAGISCGKLVEGVKWVWIGHWEPSMQEKVDLLLSGNEALKDIFIFPGIQSETDIFYGGADVFALTSREDPFPSVVLEALEAQLPVVAFESAGGFAELLKNCGELVEHGNSSAFGLEVSRLLHDSDRARQYGMAGSELIRESFSFRHYLFDILELVGIKFHKTSVVIPNYNYEHYLKERINSIINQTYPIYEILFLDDFSADNSLSLAKDLLSKSSIDFRLIVNNKNSGSVFHQWKLGSESARGEYLWIAEADDYCDINFLKEVTKPLKQGQIGLSYCESNQVDSNNKILSNHYLDYISDIDSENWRSSYIHDGVHEIENYLCIKNTIPNVSAVVFNRNLINEVFKNEIKNILEFKIAGDWFIYINILKKSRVAFSIKPLNYHRRHSESITKINYNETLYFEIIKLQEYISDMFNVSKFNLDKAKNYICYLENYLKIKV